MRFRGEALLAVMLLVMILSSGMAAGVVVHEDFTRADEDVYAVVSFLADTKMLCEESLSAVLNVNMSITGVEDNTSLGIMFSAEMLNDSLVWTQRLQKKLSYKLDVVERIKGNASSYQYLQSFLHPLQQLGMNVTRFVAYHHSIVGNLTRLGDLITQNAMDAEEMVCVRNARSAVVHCRSCLQDIEQHLTQVEESFSTTLLREMISQLYILLQEYDTYLSALMGYLPGVTQLVLLLNDDHVFLGDTIRVAGYFVADRSFVSNHTIHIRVGGTETDTVMTNDDGDFFYNYTVPLDYGAGETQVNASARYNNTLFYSDDATITVSRIPTRISVSTGRRHYFVNETIRFSGTLSNHQRQGIPRQTVSIHVGAHVFQAATNQMGAFNYSINSSMLPIDEYEVYAAFAATETYQPCHSKKRMLFIVNDSIPTYLTLAVSRDQLKKGEQLHLTGYLRTMDDVPVAYQPIVLYRGDDRLGMAETNETGYYTMQWNTGGVSPGDYTVHAVFSPGADGRYGGCTSASIGVTVLPVVWSRGVNVLSSPLALLLAGVVAAAVVLALLWWRQPFRRWFSRKKKTPTPSSYYASSPESASSLESVLFPSEATALLRHAGGARNSIIRGYVSFLRFLSNLGVSVVPSHTHRDIQQELLNQGLPRDAVDAVTQSFERARYSRYPVEEKDAARFDEHLLTLLREAKGVGG